MQKHCFFDYYINFISVIKILTAISLFVCKSFMVAIFVAIFSIIAKVKTLYPLILNSYSVLHVERAKGIEPSLQAWEARVLPLNYARISTKLWHVVTITKIQANFYIFHTFIIILISFL